MAIRLVFSTRDSRISFAFEKSDFPISIHIHQREECDIP